MAEDESRLLVGDESYGSGGDTSAQSSSNPEDVFNPFFETAAWNYQDPGMLEQPQTLPTSQPGFTSTAWAFPNSMASHMPPTLASGFSQAPQYPQQLASDYHGAGQPLRTSPSQDQLPDTPLSSRVKPHMMSRNLQEPFQMALPQSIPYKSPESASSIDLSIQATGTSLQRGKKRKIQDEDEDEDEYEEDGKPVKKSAHNMIEKRYRNNLNDKIAALRESVPSLRIMTKSARGEDITLDREELQGLTPAHKLNKATVRILTFISVRECILNSYHRF